MPYKPAYVSMWWQGLNFDKNQRIDSGSDSHNIQIWDSVSLIELYIGQFQVTVFSRFCYVLLRNHEYIHCLNQRQAKDYITRRNETERKL